MRTYILLLFLGIPFFLQAQDLLDIKLDVQIEELSIEDALLHLSEKPTVVFLSIVIIFLKIKK